MMQIKKLGKFRFEEFEVDLAARSLRRDGRFVAISPKTFDMLVFFLMHPGRMVTQDELLRALWPNATVEESNLTQHVFLLRKALAGYEPGENLLSSIPRKGYQLTATVTFLPDSPEEEPTAVEAPVLEAVMRNPIEATIEESDLPAKPPPLPEKESAPEKKKLDEHQGSPEPSTPPAWRRWRIPGSAAAVILLAIGGWLVWRGTHRPAPASLSLVVADFQNSTGHREFDNALRVVLTANLEQSPYLNVASAEKVARVLEAGAAGTKAPAQVDHDVAGTQEPDPNAPAPLSASRARQSCLELKDQAYTTGSIKRLAVKYMVTVQAFNCASNRQLAQTRGIADSPDGVLAVMAKVAADVRKQLGEPLPSIDRFSKPLFASGSNTATATEVYAEGLDLIAEEKPNEAVSLLQRATELDPQFALAFAALGQTYNSLGQHNLAASNLSKAYEIRNTLDDLHRLTITSLYYDTVTGDLNAGIRNDREWIGLYPRDPAPYSDLADLQIQLGKPALALDPAKHALELDPENPLVYVTLARAQMHMGQFEEAASVCRQAVSRHLDVAPIHNFLLQIAFLRLDQPAMDEQFAWAHNRPSEPYMLLQQALIDFALGKVKAAQSVMANVAASYRKQGETDRANRMQAQMPRIEAELGMVESATSLLERLPTMPGSTDIPVAWAHVGETSRAEALRSAELDDHPAATLWQEYNGPQITAAIDLNLHKPEAAVEALEVASRYDLRSFEVPALRGRALLAAKQPAFAEAEFHHILDHPGIEPFSHNYPLAQLGLARALAQQGKTVDAGFAYKVLLSIWKDADPDLPRLKEAKAEYARLNVASSASSRPAPSAKTTAIKTTAGKTGPVAKPTASRLTSTPPRFGSPATKTSPSAKPRPSPGLHP